MSALMFLIPLSILIVTAGTALLLWAIRNGQYQDLDNRMPDEPAKPQATKAGQTGTDQKPNHEPH